MKWEHVLWWATLLLAAWQGGLGWIDVFTESRAYVSARGDESTLEVGEYLGDTAYVTPRANVAAWVSDEHQTWILEHDGEGGYRLVQVVGETDRVRTQLWPWIVVTPETDPARTSR